MAEHIQRKTDENTANIPVWHGEPGKDEFSLQAYIGKLDSAKQLLTLTEAVTFQYFQQSVRGSAAAWLDCWLLENRNVEQHWANVKPAFRKSFGDKTTTFTFAKDITAANLATYGGDFNKFYSYVAKTTNLHCEPFVAKRIVLPENHGFNNAQQAIIAQIVATSQREIHDQIVMEFFLHGLPKAMYDKVLSKKDFTKPSEVIEYLKECDEAARKNIVIAPQPAVPMAAHITPIEDDQIEAANSYNNNPNRGNFRGRYNNTRGRGNASSSRGQGTNNSNRGASTNSYRGQAGRGQSAYRGNSNNSNANNANNSQNARKQPPICIYCKKTGHDQEKCFERIRDNQPCLTAKGAQYYPQKVAANAEREEEMQQSAETYSVFRVEV